MAKRCWRFVVSTTVVFFLIILVLCGCFGALFLKADGGMYQAMVTAQAGSGSGTTPVTVAILNPSKVADGSLAAGATAAVPAAMLTMLGNSTSVPTDAQVGLGRIVALYYRSSTSYQIH
jgi:hypothetical protein